MQTLCSVLPDAVAKSTRASFDAFGSCDSAEAVRNAFAPVTENARLGEVWGTNGMHGAPGNRMQQCDRLVLFLAAAPEGPGLYDGATQTNGALIMGIYHGVFSLKCMQYIVETELVDGMPVTRHMNSELQVTQQDLRSIGVSLSAFRLRAQFVDQGDFWSEIVQMVHITIHLGTAISTHYRGQGDESSRRRDGEDRHTVRTICEEAYQVLTTPTESARHTLIAALDRKYRRPGGPRHRECKRSNQRGQTLLGWNILAKVWQKATDNHQGQVAAWVLRTRSET